MAEKVVSHALFDYVDPDGTRRVALRGDRINVDGDELARGEQFGAFFADEDVSDVSSPLDGALVGDDEDLEGIVEHVDLVAAVAGLDDEQRAELAAALAASAASSPSGAQPTPLDLEAVAAADELSSTGVLGGPEAGELERPPLTANKPIWIDFRVRESNGRLTAEQLDDLTKPQLQDDAHIAGLRQG